jgi:Tol biopolymer transport system component
LPSGLGVTLVLSPDGSTFAVMAAGTEADVKNSQARIFTVSVNGSGFRELCGPFPVNRTWDLLRWTPDGRSLLFAMAKETKVGWRIMRVPAAGGQPVFDGLDSTNLTGSVRVPTLGPLGPFNIDLSPDGSRMSVGARTQASNELWALENVMSVLSGSR